MEPASERNKKIEGKHLSIALQGGGVKGISYIGAKEALKEVMNETPIKSVIGSSAGGIIGLSLCCEMTVSEI
jgi:predicted acylesterase/phospholipase RssA